MKRLLIVGLLFVQTVSVVVYAQGPWDAKARDILATIVAFRTQAGFGQVPPMTAYLKSELLAGGFAEDDIVIEPFGETATFVAYYRSESLTKKAPILLLAHMDVVAADPDDWVLNPFELTEKDGNFYGRGVADNKLGVAHLTTLFLRLKAEGFAPNRDLIIVFSGDEETAQESTAMLAAKEPLREAEYALNSDAGGSKRDAQGNVIAYFLQASEKTYASFDITIRNSGGHSSLPRADNAIYQLADALKRIEAYRFPVRVNEITLGFMSAVADLEQDKQTSNALRQLAKSPGHRRAAEVLRNKPAYVGITRTTCVATQLKAGHAENALPQRASATINCRIFPDVDPETVRRALAGAAGELAEVTLIDKAYFASASPLREDVTAAVVGAMQQFATDVPVIPSMIAGYTDGSYFRAAGVPTYGVAYASFEGANAHGLNEHLPVEALADGLDFWHALVSRLASGVGSTAGTTNDH